MRKQTKIANNGLIELRRSFIQSIVLISFLLVALVTGLVLGEERILVMPYFLGLIPIAAYGFSALQVVLLFHPMDFKSMIKLIKGVNN